MKVTNDEELKMTANNIFRLSIALTVISSVFFGFVLASFILEMAPQAVVTVATPPLPSLQVTESEGDRPAIDFRQIAELVSPAVVNITALATRTEDVRSSEGGSPPRGGSGIIIDTDGFILTNWHVVEDSDKLIVTLIDDSRFNAEVVGGDSLTDIALIKIKPRGKLNVAVLGDSSAVRPGDWAIAIGHPAGLMHTITVGVVSAIGRNFESNAAFWDFIQTDAAINPGNSGGPLLNDRGEVIGINTMIFRDNQNLGFSIPINLAKMIVTQLRESGKVQRGYLGLLPGAITEDMRLALDLTDREGVIVNTVVRNIDNAGNEGPAYKAGIAIGDVITSFDGAKVQSVEQFYVRAAYTPPGTTVKVEAIRDGRPMTFRITLASRPGEEDLKIPRMRSSGGSHFLGLKVARIDPGVRSQLRRASQGEVGNGVRIEDLNFSSDAYNKGIRPGDIISRVGNREVSNPEEFLSAAREALSKAEAVLLYVGRPNDDFISWRFIAVRELI
jgi:serine protease Do